MEVKKLLIITCLLGATVVSAQQVTQNSDVLSEKARKKAERRERINQLIKQEEEGALIYNKQNAYGFKFNSDGWGIFYEHGKYKNINTTNLWWLEFGERKHPKEEKAPTFNSAGGFLILSSYIFGKRNNFYNLKFGLGQQKLIGGKGNKNGVAVSAIYGGGLTIGMLKPYYLQVRDSLGFSQQVKYNNNDNVFLDPGVILGRGSFTKGFGEMKFVPGVHAKTALRFDYGRYNELLSAIEVGLNAEFYANKMPIMLLNKEKNFFFNAYVALTFGKRK